MIKNKSKKWSLYENRRLSCKFFHLMQQSQVLRTTSEKDKATDKSRIEEAKKICDSKRAYNLSGTDIPKETEELIGRLGFNFQFTERKFPSLAIITAAKLCAQRIESQ